jgi:hypothetical protein
MKSKHGFNGNWDGIVRNEKLIAEQKVNPYRKPFTICDVMADKNNYRFMRLMQAPDAKYFWRILYNNHPNMKTTNEDPGPVPDWVNELWKYGEALQKWFTSQRGNKDRFIPKILEMASCKNKAPWASWSGTAWRGLARSMKAVATYKMTDEVSDWGGRLWLVGTTAYKSKYPIQSWTNFQDSSLEFASPHMTAGADVGVVLETKISKNEGFLSHEVTNLNNENFEEFEVIRISNKETIVKAYVKIEEIVSWLYKQFNFDNKKKYPDLSLLINSQSPSFIVECINKLAPVFGHDLAKKLMRPSHPFRKELDLRVQSLLYTKVQYGR